MVEPWRGRGAWRREGSMEEKGAGGDEGCTVEGEME